MRLLSLWLACRCWSRTSSSFCERWMPSSWGMARVVASGTIPVDVRRGWGRFVDLRFPLKDPRWTVEVLNYQIRFNSMPSLFKA